MKLKITLFYDMKIGTLAESIGQSRPMACDLSLFVLLCTLIDHHGHEATDT